MLKNHDSSAILAVSDLERARHFYGEVLELESEEEEGVIVYHTGATKLVVYQSEFAGTNKANAVVWSIALREAQHDRDEFDEIVAALEAKGVAFEHYPDIGRLEGNVHVADRARLVWLKDPDGNILHINSM